MRILFMGNVHDYSARFLEALAVRTIDPDDPVEVVGVVCPAVRPGRAGALVFTAKRGLGSVLDRLSERRLPAALGAVVGGAGSGVHRDIQRQAHRCGAPIFWPTSMTDEDVGQRIAGLRADVGIVAGLDRILREQTLSVLPPMFNVHPSMLPEYRGPAPEFWQLDDGITQGGVTIHQIDRGVDTGPIVLQRSFPIDPWLDAEGLIARSVEVGTELVDELLDAGPTTLRSTRPTAEGSYQPFPDNSMSFVPFERSASRAFDRARAIGFARPLRIRVPTSEWQAGRAAVACEPSADATTLELYEPVPHVDARVGQPGLVTPIPTGGALISCESGVLEFRRVTETLPSSDDLEETP